MIHFPTAQDDIDQMKKLHSELGVITTALQTIHKDPKACHQLSNVGVLFNFIIVSDEIDVHNYLSLLPQIAGTSDALDLRMRLYLYFLLSLEGSVQSQMVNCT